MATRLVRLIKIRGADQHVRVCEVQDRASRDRIFCGQQILGHKGIKQHFQKSHRDLWEKISQKVTELTSSFKNSLHKNEQCPFCRTKVDAPGRRSTQRVTLLQLHVAQEVLYQQPERSDEEKLIVTVRVTKAQSTGRRTLLPMHRATAKRRFPPTDRETLQKDWGNAQLEFTILTNFATQTQFYTCSSIATTTYQRPKRYVTLLKACITVQKRML